jgi:hypothetical protein
MKTIFDILREKEAQLQEKQQQVKTLEAQVEKLRAAAEIVIQEDGSEPSLSIEAQLKAAAGFSTQRTALVSAAGKKYWP